MNYLGDANAGRRVRSLLDDFFLDVEDWMPRAVNRSAGQYLALDVREFPDRFEVKANAPGVAKEAIELSFEKNLLRITVHAGEERQEENAKYLHRERDMREMTRTVALPGTAAADVDAALKDGVLTVTVKKEREQIPRKVEIK